MKPIVVLLAFFAFATLAAPAGAQTWSNSASSWGPVDHSSGALKSGVTVRISGSLKGTTGPSEVGQCTQGFSNQCPSGHSCECAQMTDAKFSSSILGAGTANVFLTVDETAYGLDNLCAPIFAEVDYTTKNDVGTLDAVGAGCNAPIGTEIAGNTDFGSSNVLRYGFASFAGTINGTTTATKVIFSGFAVTK